MKRIILILPAILCFYNTALAYLEPSFRIKALGEDFVGIIVDEYTDIYRNPAYLGQLQNYKILGEYRKDGSNRFIGGWILPKFGFGKIAILGRGWHQENGSLLQGQDISINPYYIYQQIYLSDYNNKSSLSNPALFYSISSDTNLSLGIKFIYFEDRLRYTSEGNLNYYTFDTRSGFLRNRDDNRYESNFLKANKFYQVSSGLKFIWKQTLLADIVLTFQHIDLDQSNNESRFSQDLEYDTLGNLTRSFKYVSSEEIFGPIQKGNSFGIVLRASKPLTSMERINLVWGFSYSDWDTEAQNGGIYIENDTLISNLVQQSFNGDKKDIEFNLKLGFESKKMNKFKLYGGIVNYLVLEKHTSQDSIPIKPDSRFKTSYYKISLPLGIEYSVLNKLTIRYGATPNYAYTKSEGIYRYNFLWETTTNKTTKFNNSFGFSSQLLKSLIIEGYILDSANLVTLGSWTIGTSYSF